MALLRFPVPGLLSPPVLPITAWSNPNKRGATAPTNRDPVFECGPAPPGSLAPPFPRRPRSRAAAATRPEVRGAATRQGAARSAADPSAPGELPARAVPAALGPGALRPFPALGA